MPSSFTAANGDAIVNVSGYRFVTLDALATRRDELAAALGAAGVLGTVLLAEEGVNVALAGDDDAIVQARAAFDRDPSLAGLRWKESRSAHAPFSRLKVRVRREIIAFDGAGGRAGTAPVVSPATLRGWLDGERDIVLLDTRNRYEIDAGGFPGAIDLGIDHFRDFGEGVERALARGELSLEQPLVTFCTGGIRCEKAAPWLLARGFRSVHQIEDGILGWFASEGDAHWKGDCFVFDDRVSVTPSLGETGARLCRACHRAVPSDRPGCDHCRAGQPTLTADETV